MYIYIYIYIEIDIYRYIYSINKKNAFFYGNILVAIHNLLQCAWIKNLRNFRKSLHTQQKLKGN